MKTFLSNENIDLAIQYALGNDRVFESLDPGYRNLFLAILGDSNSSMLREAMVLRMLNYVSYPEKHGMDGYCPITNKQKEVKPKFIVEKQKIGATSGNFNDMTTELLDKKDGCDVICAGFYEGRFLYIIEIPYEVIKPKLRTRVDNAKIGKRVVCEFGYKNYDHDSLQVKYLNEALITKTNSLSKPHFDMLKKRYNATS
jgi:hypothetical protein